MTDHNSGDDTCQGADVSSSHQVTYEEIMKPTKSELAQEDRSTKLLMKRIQKQYVDEAKRKKDIQEQCNELLRLEDKSEAEHSARPNSEQLP